EVAEGGESEAEESDAGALETEDSGATPDAKKDKARRADVSRELYQLVELATKYPEIGPPLAQLAFKVGRKDIGERVLRMGIEGDERGVEFYFVAATVARREKRPQEALAKILEAVQDFLAGSPEQADDDEANRLLHLIRLGFAVLMFDLEDVRSEPDYSRSLCDALPKLEERFGDDAFYYSLKAQALWFKDAEASEQAWDRAVEMDPESSWNARGTWYKEAEKDLPRAESAYRQGLSVAPDSTLLRLNLAQVLMDRVDDPETETKQAVHWLKESEGLLKNALRGAPRNLRRHVHENLDRVEELRSDLPADEAQQPAVGDVVKGRVVSLVPYGAFLGLRGGHSGLLHKSEIAHEWVDDPAQHLRVGDQLKVKIIEIKPRKEGEGLRIGLSRKALLPAPEKPVEAPVKADTKTSEDKGGRARGGRDKGGRARGGRDKGRDKRSRDKGGREQGPTQEKSPREGQFTLGEMLMAKLSEKEKNS
ncbi:MAG: S1 RNA-binding domain-containing protein, partial [Bradymonadaceae bacterium]